MPNWVFNTITASKEVIADIKQRFINKEGNFDFNYFIPMPKSLNVTCGSSNAEDIYYYLSDRNTLPLKEVIEKGGTLHNSYGSPVIDQSIADRVTEMLSKGREPDFNMGYTLINNCRKYGCMTWYDWCIDNWDTKWNACDTYADAEDIHFNTAWSVPEPILKKLCMMYPDEEIDFYCEEESGWFVEYKNDNGDLVTTNKGEVTFDDWREEEEEENETV